MKIEFDRAKRDETLFHRGLDMQRADEIFVGNTITVEDDRKDYGEARLITVGLLEGRMIVLVWTPRGAARQSSYAGNPRRMRAFQGRSRQY